MDPQAIGASKKYISKPGDKSVRCRRTSAAELIATVSICVYFVVVANGKDKDNNCLHSSWSADEVLGLSLLPWLLLLV